MQTNQAGRTRVLKLDTINLTLLIKWEDLDDLVMMVLKESCSMWLDWERWVALD